MSVLFLSHVSFYMVFLGKGGDVPGRGLEKESEFFLKRAGVQVFFGKKNWRHVFFGKDSRVWGSFF